MRGSFKQPADGFVHFLVFDPEIKQIAHETFDPQKGPRKGHFPLLKEGQIEGVFYTISLKGDDKLQKKELSLDTFKDIIAENDDKSGLRGVYMHNLATIQYNSITKAYHFVMESSIAGNETRLPTKGRLLVTKENLEEVIEKMLAGDDLLSMTREQRSKLEEARREAGGIVLCP